MSERVRGGYSLHNEEKPELCGTEARCGPWRTVQCANDIDVIECALCGKQRTESCTFDEEMS